MTFYQTIIKDGHQRNIIDIMQPREEMYGILGYHDYEQKLDKLFSEEKT